MSSSLLLEQCPVCLAYLTWMIFEMGGCTTVFVVVLFCFLSGVVSRICSKQHVASLSTFHLDFSPIISSGAAIQQYRQGYSLREFLYARQFITINSCFIYAYVVTPFRRLDWIDLFWIDFFFCPFLIHGVA